MQNCRFVIQILAILALFSAAQAVARVEINSTLVCTEHYWVSVNYFEATAGDQVIFAGSVSGSPATRYILYTVPTSGSGSVGTYIAYAGSSASNIYYAQMKSSSGTFISQTTLNIPSCTGLTITGLAASKQAVWLADVYRKDTDSTAPAYFWNSHLQTAATDILSNTAACAPWQTNDNPYLKDRGYSDTSDSICVQIGSSADAGGLIQFLRDGAGDILQTNWGTYDEVAFAQDATNRIWIMILANRKRHDCGNKYRATLYEECDDGNNDDNDGCHSDCTVEAGWTCSESVLLEGSTCVQSPMAPTTPTAVPIASPTTAPQASAPITAPTASPTASTPTVAPTTATPTAVPSVAPTSTTPTGTTPTGNTPTAAPHSTTPSSVPSSSTPSATPKSSTPTATPQGTTPSVQTPTGQTPSAQTPTSQTPTGQTPSVQTPSSSSPQGSTPSSSPSVAPSVDSPVASTPGDNSPSDSQSPDSVSTPSDAPSITPSTDGPLSPRPSRTPASSGIVSGSEQITASIMMVIVTMLSAIIATF